MRVIWIITDWFRTEAYYASGGWRATWKGEGGGVLLNQCLHNLDTLALALRDAKARPRLLRSSAAITTLKSKTTLPPISNTPMARPACSSLPPAKRPGTNRFEIAGTRGKARARKQQAQLHAQRSSTARIQQDGQGRFRQTRSLERDIPFTDAVVPHAILMQNFVDAILDGTPLIAPGEEGIHSVELANVMLYSSLLGQTVDLPMSGADYEQSFRS